MSKYYLGSDVSKGYADFILIDRKKNIIEDNFQLDDTRLGHQQLEHFLAEFFDKNPKAKVFAAFESTGGYENNWIHTLQKLALKMPVKVARLNPWGIYHGKKAALKRNSTDKISAFAIAKYQINHPDVIRYNDKNPYQSLKKLFKAYRSLLKIKTQFVNQLESLLYTAHPELVKYRKDNTPLWFLQLLVQYPVADDLAKARVEDLVKIPFINAQRATKLISAAQNSIASATDEPTKELIKVLVQQIFNLDQSIKKLEKQAKSFVNVPEIALISSIDSIGVISAIGLFVELGGNISNFASGKKLAAFWGLNPALKESGDGSMVPKMSKQGRVLPRNILYMVVMNGIQNNGLIADLYKKELRKGKCKMSAMGVCMNKMARIIFGVLKNNTPYDPEINRKHQQRSKPKRDHSKPKNNYRRFQKNDPDAPISRKQIKKRKEREQSQSEHVAVSEIKPSLLIASTLISDNEG